MSDQPPALSPASSSPRSPDAHDFRFRTIFEQSPVSTQVFSPDGRTILVNRAWEQLWGITLEQLGAYNVLEDQQFAIKGVMSLIERGFAGEFVEIPAIRYVPAETFAVPGAVPYRWVRALIYPVRDVDGAVSEIVLMQEDITEQRRAEAALKESEQRFRAMFYGAPVGISLVDRDGKYLAVNPARQQMLGYSEEELIGQSYLAVTHPDDIAYDERMNAEARLQDAEAFQLEKRFLRRTGETVWSRITAALVRDEAGETLYSVSIAEDITAQKLAEQEHARLDRQKDEFLSAVAHDLRTPLTTIKGRIQILRVRSDRGVLKDADLSENLARMDANATRMVTLINELLDVANLQIGRSLNLLTQPTDLVELVRSVAAEHQQVSDLHTITVDTEREAIVGVWDAQRLERVLANLISNAIKYSPRGGEITVSVSREDEPAVAMAVFSVSDSGIGIPAADLPHVFDRFHRAMNVTGSIPGTGIGLAAVKANVEQHGGTISVESEEGKGARFTVRLPIDSAV